EVAGVGAARLADLRGARAVDPVAADRLHQTGDGVGHVAVLAAAADGLARVVRVGLDVLAERGMTLQAGLVRAAVLRELVVGGGRVVHRVAGEAGELASLEAGGLDHAVVLAARDADHAVGPEAL